MTEKEAIERLKNFNDGFTFKDCDVCDNYNEKNSCCNKKKCNELQAIETVLNLLEKKDRQLEEKTNRIRNLEKECQKHFDNMMDIIQDNCKKDKEIDLMAEQLAGLTIFDNDIENALILGDKEEVKKCFERKVENGN